jgi:hypothetical protein
MSDRNRRLFIALLVLAAAVVLGYAAFVLVQILRGDYEAGPLRLFTLGVNVATGLLALGSAIFFARTKPPRG